MTRAVFVWASCMLVVGHCAQCVHASAGRTWVSREVRAYGTAEERAAVYCINATKGVRAHHQTSDRKKSMTSTLTNGPTD